MTAPLTRRRGHLRPPRFALSLGVLMLIALCLPLTALGTGRADSLVGTWHLVRYVDTPDGGTPVYAFGNPPVGLFIFTADGHVSISIMRNPPDIDATTTDPDPEACIPGWYCAYFGTYTVNYERGTWVSHVLGGNIPAYLGTEQSRTFKLEGDTLTVSESYTAGGRHFSTERVLRRETTAQ